MSQQVIFPPYHLTAELAFSLWWRIPLLGCVGRMRHPAVHMHIFVCGEAFTSSSSQAGGEAAGYMLEVRQIMLSV